MRTCIACRKKRDKRELIRLICDNHGTVVRDVSGKGQGRGAYVCPKKSCLESASKGGRLNRAFKKESAIVLHYEVTA
jgi:predicted RNA-binding protein YlxR (DUF448 family)